MFCEECRPAPKRVSFIQHINGCEGLTSFPGQAAKLPPHFSPAYVAMFKMGFLSLALN